MPKYLWRACYTAQGTRGLVKAGGSKRKKAVEAALRTVGGKLEAFYFALGDVDVYIIADVPGNVSIAAASLVINAAGAVAVWAVDAGIRAARVGFGGPATPRAQELPPRPPGGDSTSGR